MNRKRSEVVREVRLLVHNISLVSYTAKLCFHNLIFFKYVCTKIQNFLRF